MDPKATVTEIGPDLYRLSIYVPAFDLQFNHFLIDDDEPMLYHAGLKGMFPLLKDAVTTVLDPARLRWVGFSHFESDECGGLNDWPTIAPSAEPACSDLGALVSVNDFSLGLFQELVALKPERLAIMHGSSFEGHGARALADLGVGFKEVFGQSAPDPADA